MGNFEIARSSVAIAAKILKIPTPDIKILNSKAVTKKRISGMYMFEKDEIVFNEKWLEVVPEIEVIVTAYHETRHAYQGYCVKTGTRETDETIAIWKKELTNYLQPSGTNIEENDIEYLNQRIEIDAIAFTHKYVKEHYKMKTYIPKCIKSKVESRLNAV